MSKLALLALAAGLVALPGAASAQVVTNPGPNVMVRQHGGAFMHPGPNFPRHRLRNGFFVHPFFFGPQFHVQNWQLYGFSAPPRDHRWVRHFDDAYLIDREGRVADHRYGLDWDEYGERWEVEDGIPSYYGRNEWRPGPEDYAWFERHGYGDDRDEREYAGHRRGHGYDDDRDGEREYAGHRREHRYDDDRDGYDHDRDGTAAGPYGGCGPSPCGGYAPAYGYGGYGVVAYPIIIETTVVTGGGCGCTEVIEEVVEVSERPRRYRRRAQPPRRHAPPPPPPPAGERG